MYKILLLVDNIQGLSINLVAKNISKFNIKNKIYTLRELIATKASVRISKCIYFYITIKFEHNSADIKVRFYVTIGVARRCSVKKTFLKISQILQEKTCAGVTFYMQLYQKRDSDRGIFLCILQNF